MGVQKKLFTGGMDVDTTSELLPEGRDRYRLNVRVLSSDNSTVGSIETVNGNSLVSFTLPAGNNICIGSREDLVNKKVYYLVYNSLDSHLILEFDSVSNVISKVFQDSVDILNNETNILRFSPDYLITGINIVELDKENHLFYWTDNYVDPNDPNVYNEPKKINIEKGKLRMAGNYTDGYPQIFDPEILYRIKQPMLLSPTAVYADDIDVNINRLVNKFFQFKVQYVYDDNEVSAFSPISKTPYPLSNLTLQNNNVIKVTFDTGIEIVKRIRIAVKEVNSEDFELAAELDKAELGIASNSSYTYDFFNNTLTLPILLKESIKLYDKVPKRSQSQDILPDNRIVDGLITEEFDPVPIDLKIGMSINQDILTYSLDYIIILDPGEMPRFGFSDIITIDVSPTGDNATAIVSEVEISAFDVTDPGFGYGIHTVTISGGGGTGMTADAVESGTKITAVNTVTAGSGYTYPPNVAIYPSPLGSGFDATAEAYMKIKTITITNHGSGYINTPGVSSALTSSSLVGVLSTKGYVPRVSLKRGGSYTYGIIYYDHGNRSGLTNINDGSYDAIQSNGRYGTNLFVPFYTEASPLQNAELSFTMEVDGINIINAGSGYSPATTFTFVGGGVVVPATATPVIGDGAITELDLTNIGAGYTPDGSYTVDLLGGSGTGAQVGIVIVGGVVDSFGIANGGSGYLAGDNLTVDPSTFIPPPGTDATFDVLASDFETIIGITITNAGSYTGTFPTITIADSGGGVNGDVQVTMKVESVAVADGGAGYTVVPDANFTGGGYQELATLTTAIGSGQVISVTLTDPGAGYTSFPTLAVDGRVWGGSFPELDWRIYNEPPAWATHYQIARTMNGSNGRYIQFVMDSVQYLDKEGAPINHGDPEVTQIKIKISNIYVEYRSSVPGSILTYDFAPGDRFRPIEDINGNLFNEYYDFAISKFDSANGYIYIVFPEELVPNNIPRFTGGRQFEIYQPNVVSDDKAKITYEIGCGNTVSFDSVTGKYLHNGDVDDQTWWQFTTNTNAVSGSGTLGFVGALPHGLSAGDDIRVYQNGGSSHPEYNTYFTVTSIVSATEIAVDGTYLGSTPAQGGFITKCAKGDFVGGDTFYRPRTMPYDSGTGYVTLLIEDANYSDEWESKGYDYGRPNRIDPTIKEITRVSTIYFSEQLIPETEINGLSSVYDTSFQSYEQKYGGIYKLYAEDHSLNVFQEIKTGSLPTSQIVVTGTNNAEIVGQSSDILPPVMKYYAGEFGIGRSPESFAVYGNAKYFIDVRRGTPVRLSIDGLTPLGDVAFMHNYFNDKCQAILNSTSKVNIYGVYDVKFKEYVLAFGSGVGVSAETLAFNEKANQWSTFYSFVPEGLVTNGTDIISFKNGGLWKHNANAVQNNFYGVQYNSEVWMVLNSEFSQVKIFEAIGEEGLVAWEAPEISNTNGQLTNLIPADFQLIEGMQYAPLLFDQNTPNVTNPLIEGDTMRAQTFLVKLRYPLSTYNKLFAVNFNYIISNLHQ